jgi:hypothetical protein
MAIRLRSAGASDAAHIKWGLYSRSGEALIWDPPGGSDRRPGERGGASRTRTGDLLGAITVRRGALEDVQARQPLARRLGSQEIHSVR